MSTAATAMRSPWRGIGPRDVRLAVAVAAVQILGTVGVDRHVAHPHGGCWWGPCHGSPVGLGPVAFVLLAVGPAALLLRRRWPEPVLGVVFVATAVYAALGYPAGPVFLSLVVAFLTVVVGGNRWLGVAAIVAGWALLLWLPGLAGHGGTPSAGGALGLGAWLAALLAAAELIRGRRERAAAVRAGRAQEERRRAEEERLRIARELHDVLAHNISLINVQSGVALHLLDEQPEQARSALSIINDASADALREVRSVLGVLRGVDEQVPRAPTPGLAQLDQLVARSAAAGVRVDVAVEGRRRPLPTSVDLAVFRIVQESLTNVVRHSGADAARVELGFGEEELSVRVEDDGLGAAVAAGPGRGGDGPPGGNGIAGMRERATALGGALEAGPRPAGRGFRVAARFPIGSSA